MRASRPRSQGRVSADFGRTYGVAKISVALALGLMVWLLAGAVAGAQAPAELRVSIDRDTVTVGDRIKATVTLTVPADAQADFRTLETQFGDLELLVVGLPQDTLLGDGRRQVAVTYELAAFRTGALALPALTLEVRLPDGSIANPSTQPVPITVQSVIPPDQNPTDVRDLKPQVSFPLTSGISARQVALIVAAVALGLVAAVLLARRLLRPKPVLAPPAEPALSPEAAARAELDRIAASGLLEGGQYKRLHAELAACIRRYLTAKYNFPAFAMTTTELRRMEQYGVGRWQARLVHGLLTESDAVNFAQYRPAYTRCEQNIEMAYQIVDAGEPVVEEALATA